MPRPMSGSRLAPKIRIMMNRMTSSSGIPRWGIMVAPSGALSAHLITNCGRRRLYGRAVLGAVLLALGARPAPAQFTSSVNVVEVYATVTDAKGGPVTGLAKEDFIVRENGEAQQVSTFAAGQFPLSVAVALDRSFSMAGER